MNNLIHICCPVTHHDKEQPQVFSGWWVAIREQWMSLISLMKLPGTNVITKQNKIPAVLLLVYYAGVLKFQTICQFFYLYHVWKRLLATLIFLLYLGVYSRGKTVKLWSLLPYFHFLELNYSWESLGFLHICDVLNTVASIYFCVYWWMSKNLPFQCTL